MERPVVQGRRTDREAVEGLLVLDKPPGMSSSDLLGHLKKRLPRSTRLGHTGTLDPMATGVLVVCLGPATRLCEYVQQMSKTYQTTIRLGATSNTDDATGVVVAREPVSIPSFQQMVEVVKEFEGAIDQVPPDYSAAWVTGKRAYELARKGKPVNLAARRILIHRITLQNYAWPLLDLEIDCAKGTYIRSLARDLGQRLGCGGLVETLRRTRVGPFQEKDLVTLNTPADSIRQSIRPVVEAVAELPQIIVQPEDAVKLSFGQKILAREWTFPLAEERVECAMIDSEGRFIGIGKWDAKTGLLRPDKIWRDAQDGQTPMTL